MYKINRFAGLLLVAVAIFAGVQFGTQPSIAQSSTSPAPAPTPPPLEPPVIDETDDVIEIDSEVVAEAQRA